MERWDRASSRRQNAMGLEDKVKNKAARASGKVKQAVGKLTNNEQLESEGRVQNENATLAEDAEKLKDDVKRSARHVRDVFR
jgi:uncharacterized protein YjbJ (UPF0337 family)